MPSRIIKETIIISESLTAISADAERFFWRLVVKFFINSKLCKLLLIFHGYS